MAQHGPTAGGLGGEDKIEFAAGGSDALQFGAGVGRTAAHVADDLDASLGEIAPQGVGKSDVLACAAHHDQDVPQGFATEVQFARQQFAAGGAAGILEGEGNGAVVDAQQQQHQRHAVVRKEVAIIGARSCHHLG